jgi:hypothetical protein
MRIYLSYGMTNCLPCDRELRKRVREKLNEWVAEDGPDFYDPELDEPGGQTLEFLQNYDFDRMAECDGVFVIWGDGTLISNGVAAEIEWARRLFGIPVVIYNPNPETTEVPAWSRMTTRQRVYSDLKYAWNELLKLAKDQSITAWQLATYEDNR